MCVAMWLAVAMFVGSYLRHAFTTESGRKQPISSPERNSVVGQRSAINSSNALDVVRALALSWLGR